MSFLPVVLGAVGAVASAVGTYEQGAYSSQVAENNAKIANQNAQYAREAGQEKAAEASMKGAQQQARLTAGLAANNIDINSGSAADVRTSEREVNKLDTDTALQNSELTAYGYRTQATNFEAQAEQDSIGGDLGAAGSLLSNASSLGFKWAGVSPG